MFDIIHPGGLFFPHECQEPFPEDGVDASATVIGLSLPVQLLCCGGSHEMRLGALVETRSNRCIMNLFLWIVQQAFMVGLTCYIETVLDDEFYQASKVPNVLRARLFVPVPQSRAEVFIEQIKLSLGMAPVDVTVDSAGDATSGAAASMTSSAAASMQASGGGWAAASGTPLSASNISSPDSFVAAVAACIGQPREMARNPTLDMNLTAAAVGAEEMPNVMQNMYDNAEVDELDGENDALDLAMNGYADDDGEAGVAIDGDEFGDAAHTTGDPVTDLPDTNPLSMLSALHMFSPAILEHDRENGAAEAQLNWHHYVRDGRLHFPHEVRVAHGALPPLVFSLDPHLGGRIGHADQLLGFVWPIGRAPVRVLLDSCRKQLEISCERASEQLLAATNAAEVRDALRAMSASHPRKILLQPEMVRAPDFPWRPESPSAFRYPMEEIYPVQAAAAQRTSVMMRRIRQTYTGGRITAEKAQRLFQRQMASMRRTFLSETDGVESTYFRAARDAAELTNFVYANAEDQTPAGKEAAGILASLPTHAPDGTSSLSDAPGPMPFLSQNMAQFSAFVAFYLKLSSAQASVVVPIWVAVFGMGGDEFEELQATFDLIGPPDAGKSHAMNAVKLLIISSLVSQHAHMTQGNYTIPGPRSVMFTDDMRTSGSTIKTQAALDAEAQRLSMRSLGYHSYRAVKYDSTSEGNPRKLDTRKIDQRTIEVSGMNTKRDKAMESRSTRLFMNKNQSVNAVDNLPSRQEMTVSRTKDDPHVEALGAAMSIMVARAMRSWLPFASGCVRYDLTMTQIFFALTEKFLRPAGFAHMECRELKSLQRQAISYQMLINTRKYWFMTPGVSQEVLEEHVDMFMLANAVVSAEATLLAWYDIIGLTDTRREEAELLTVLKSRILDSDGELGWAPKTGQDGNSQYYVTSIRGGDDLAAGCPNLGSSIVASVLPKLEYATSDGDSNPRVKRDLSKDFKGHFMISKDAANNPNCLTSTQDAILTFLANVISKPEWAPAEGRRDWYAEVKANGEETGNIVFSKRVLDTIMGGIMLSAVSGQMPPWGHVFNDIVQSERMIAMEMFASAELFEYRGESAMSDKSATVARPCNAALPGATRLAAARGLYDPITALSLSPDYQSFFEATPSSNPSDDDVRAWLDDVPAEDSSAPKRMPGQRPHVTTYTVPVCLVVSTEVLRVQEAVQVHKCQQCNIRRPPMVTEHERARNAVQTMIDALFAISGEAEPNQIVYCGSSSSGIRWMEVGEWKSGQVRVLNPARQITADATLMAGSAVSEVDEGADDVNATILPPHQRTIMLKAGDNLYEKLLMASRQKNVPFADPNGTFIPSA